MGKLYSQNLAPAVCVCCPISWFYLTCCVLGPKRVPQEGMFIDLYIVTVDELRLDAMYRHPFFLILVLVLLNTFSHSSDRETEVSSKVQSTNTSWLKTRLCILCSGETKDLHSAVQYQGMCQNARLFLISGEMITNWKGLCWQQLKQLKRNSPSGDSASMCQRDCERDHHPVTIGDIIKALENCHRSCSFIIAEGKESKRRETRFIWQVFPA